MATVKFFIKGNNDPTSIYVRLRDGRKGDYSISTELSINPKYWNTNKSWIINSSGFKDKLNIERALRSLENHIHTKRNQRIEQGLPLNKDWFKDVVGIWQGKSREGQSDRLIDLIKDYKESLPHKVRNGKKGVSQGTIKNYNTTIQRLLKFEVKTKKQFVLRDIDLSFHDEYLKFASTVLSLSPNSIGKDIKQIKTVCLDSKDRGMKVNEQVLSRKFSAPSEKTIFTTLNPEELGRISQLKGSNYLENARDWLIIGCWTGCRASDLMKLNEKNIVLDGKGQKIIQYEQEKTNKLINVPMHPQIEEIYSRLGSFPRPISLEKFNKYIKEVCKKSGLTYKVEGNRQNLQTKRKETGSFEKWELIRSHTCRRSFATNHFHEMPNKLIMAVTGHSTERMLLAYIGETEMDHIDDFIELWSKKSDISIDNKTA